MEEIKLKDNVNSNNFTSEFSDVSSKYRIYLKNSDEVDRTEKPLFDFDLRSIKQI